MRFLLVMAIAIVAASCSFSPGKPELQTGTWRGVITMQEQELPFTFDVTKDSGVYKVWIKNGEEKIMLDEIRFEGDSVEFVLHIFDAGLKGKINGNTFDGFFIRNYDNSRLPFKATFNEDYRFAKKAPAARVDFSGKYAVIFTNESDTTPAVGIFAQQGNIVTGTFLTPTGDYRYLEGNVIGKKLYLSTFDGNHAYIFTAEKNPDNTLRGDYYAGRAYHQAWTGRPDPQAALPDEEKITYLKPGYDRIAFSFPDVNGKMVTLADSAYRDKVMVLQIFGTWCPNCLDETKFLKTWYAENKDRGVELIALAYERKDDFSYASERVKKMQRKLDVDYTFLIAGTDDKKKAGETLPMLNGVYAFPTTIFIGKDGAVKHIHTGFSGPGTGIYFERFKQRFNETINELLQENTASKR